MALQNIVGVDHVVVLTRDLDAAAKNWQRLGFTLSPRGTHSAHLGSGNYTIMLDPDYIELLGILTPTEHNAPSRAYLDERGEGLERTAFTAVDAEKLAAEIKGIGYAAVGPIDFGRPVTLPSGGETAAKFRVTQWPVSEAPAGLRIFACQHLTREAVWIPEIMHHANTAKHLARIEVLTDNPKADAEHMAKLIDRGAQEEADGAVRVESGGGRAPFIFLTRKTLEARHPGVPLDGMPKSGAVSLILVAGDLNAAQKAIGADAVKTPHAICVPPAKANGVLLGFIAPQD
ncbi:hypothetical protein GJW-30_1_03751 [Variibacter gotjawalensis]|uniref:VOC domain-containing protein n=1 Tax=Variibacter gotjawalensis TaxID=1333996 RepID=A0A0S3PZ14_9BRAD|nr:VOC family protein [Variibacter gotjawalensis]NIK47031.1 hypothetical protein [Variibacter gotjawalensis]RZS48936.1 glyoxalase-like protein [Variibacter gotjawalensis]BAT61194.1 hypothetical protein GJW-30_1_03751 [Variibacter gotjawalensis]